VVSDDPDWTSPHLSGDDIFYTKNSDTPFQRNALLNAHTGEFAGSIPRAIFAFMYSYVSLAIYCCLPVTLFERFYVSKVACSNAKMMSMTS
jgi:hypothetical protein